MTVGEGTQLEKARLGGFFSLRSQFALLGGRTLREDVDLSIGPVVARLDLHLTFAHAADAVRDAGSRVLGHLSQPPVEQHPQLTSPPSGPTPPARSARSSTRCITPTVTGRPHTGQRFPRAFASVGVIRVPQLRW